MKTRRTPTAKRETSKEEQHERRQRQRRRARELRDRLQLLFTREETAAVLGVSVATVRRLEAAGALNGLRLNPGTTRGPVLHRRHEVMRLAGADQDLNGRKS